MDPVLRENFIEHIFLYHRRQSLLLSGLTPARLVDFHTNQKFSVLVDDEAAYRVLGQIVAESGYTLIVIRSAGTSGRISNPGSAK